MMIDKFALLCDEQDVSIDVGTDLSEGSYDLGAIGTIPQVNDTPKGEVGDGGSVPLLVQVVEAFTAAGGAATLNVDVVMADDAALSSNLTVLESSGAISKASLVAGYQFIFQVFPRRCTKRYIGLKFTVATNNMDTGKISAFLGSVPQNVP